MNNPCALPETRRPERVNPQHDDNASLLLAVSTRLRQAALAHGPAAACGCSAGGAAPPLGLPGPQGRMQATRHELEELAQLRHLMLESARALEQLHAAQAEARAQPRHSLPEQLAQAHEELAHARDGERQALHLALHDALTELPNRRYLGRRLDTALHGPRTALALLFIDLNDFKHVNDLHGHAVGDELLRIVAARLNHAVRSEDLVCRLGGDEFVLLLTSAPSREQLVRLAQQLIDTIAMPIELGRASVHMRASIGIALCPPDGHTAEALLDRADSAMYRAKHSESGFAFHEPQALA